MKKLYVFSLLILCSFAFGFCQEGNIQGVIIDEQGLKVTFANINSEVLKKGTVSDSDGCDVVTNALGSKFPKRLSVSMTDNKEIYFYDLRRLNLPNN